MFSYQASVEHRDGATTSVALKMDCCVAAGYSGRNQAAVQAHIQELQQLGVAPPHATPALYWISPNRLTSHERLVVVGEQTSPQVEFFLAADGNGTIYLTVASDHSDRELESVSVAKSKQVCDKILGGRFWELAEVAAHWDELELSSRVIEDGHWLDYQEGTLAEILHYDQLWNLIYEDAPVELSPCLFSGTIPLIPAGPVYTSACEILLKDPVLRREIRKVYGITVLPDRS